jgi:probable HAF family extracellular repeat protein
LERLEDRTTPTTITDLGPVSSFIPYGLNNAGQVAGDLQVPLPGGGPTTFSNQAGVYSGGAFTSLTNQPHSHAAAINDSGQVVGDQVFPDDLGDLGAHRASLYTSGTTKDLETLYFVRDFIFPGNDFYDGESYATAINAGGQVVGYSNTAPGANDPAVGQDYNGFPVGEPHAFLYSGGPMMDLGVLPGTLASHATGINASGQVVGYSDDHAFLYSGGTMTDLATVPGGNILTSTVSSATAINNAGQVIGTGGPTGAFLYSGGVITTLRGPNMGPFSPAVTTATGINASGQVVGFTSNTRAFIYSGGVMTDLNSLLPLNAGWQLTKAIAINDSGIVLGIGFLTAPNASHLPRVFLLDGRATSTVTVTPVTATYDGTAHATAGFEYALLNGVFVFISRVPVTYNTPDGTAPVHAGTYTATGTFAGNQIYAPATGTATIVINPATPTVIFTGGTGTVTHDGQPHAATAEAYGVGGVDLGPVPVTYTPGGGPPVDAGTYTATATFPGNPDYKSATATATITIRPSQTTPTVVVNPVTATYDGTPHGTTGEAYGGGGVDLGPVPITYNPGGTAPVHAGTYTATGTFPGDQNYYAATGTATIVINPATPTVTFTGGTGTFIYDGQPHEATATATGVNGETLNPVTISYSPGGGPPVDAGTYTASATFPGNQDYTSATATATVVIAFPPVVLSPSPIQIAVVGASLPFLLGSFSDTGEGPWNVDVNWGDDTADTMFPATSTGALAAQSHTYAQVGVKTVTVTVKDTGDGQSDTKTLQIAVCAPPVLTSPGTQNVIVLAGTAQPFALGSFTDASPNPPDDGPWQVTVNWGDGSADTSLEVTGPGSLGTASHDYEPEGVYTATETVTDTFCGLADTETFQVGVVRPLLTQSAKDVFQSFADAAAKNANFDMAVANNFKSSMGGNPEFAETALLNAAEQAIQAAEFQSLAHDPVDPDFTSIAQPDLPKYPPLTPQPGLSQQLVDAFNAYFSNGEQIIGYGNALITSMDRESGAQLAGNGFWQDQQTQAASTYSQQLAPLVSAQPGLLTAFVNAWDANGSPKVSVTPSDVSNVESQIATSGLPADLLQILSQLTDSATISQIPSLLIAQDPNQAAGAYPAKLLDPSFLSSDLATSAALQAFAPVRQGQAAGIGFWHNKNGQALILALNGGGGSHELGDWLAATFVNLYGTNSGNDLAGKNNAYVAAQFQQDFARQGPKLDAQVLATALSVYATNATLDNTGVAARYGFTVSGYGVGAATVNVGSDGDAFGVANDMTLTVMDLLLATDAQSVNGVLYGGNATRRSHANDVYSFVNQAGGL